MDFAELMHKLEKNEPHEFADVSLDVSVQNHGPVFPNQAFESIDALESWYEVVLFQWMHDWHVPIDHWNDQLVNDNLKLALHSIALEARNAGVRRIHRRIFRGSDGAARAVRVGNLADWDHWCGFMLRLVQDDDAHVDAQRNHLTIRYDLGVAERNLRDRQRLSDELDPWVASMTSAFIDAVSKGKPRDVPPDDEWILTTWSGLLHDRTVDQVMTTLFVDAVEVPNTPNPVLLTDITESTWKAMRQLNVVVEPEPAPTSYAEVRAALDRIQMTLGESVRDGLSPCDLIVQREFDVFLSHNSKEKPTVRRLAKKLRKEGLRVWIDEDELRPGQPWQDSLEDIIETCKSAAILVGESGFGPWYDREVRSCLNEFVSRGLPVVPVLLPNCDVVPELPLFLKEFTWVDLRSGVRRAGIERLIWGLTGERSSVTT